MVKWAWISNEEMNGEMFSGSSGATAPMGVQLRVSFCEIDCARELEADEAGTTPNRTAMLFASCGCKVVAVALSLNAP